MAEAQQGKGALAEFLANVAKVLVPSRDGARRQLAEALLRLQQVPRSLAHLWTLDSQGSTWRCITSTDNVQWCVHPMGREEPTHDVAIVAGTSWKFLKASVYGTIVVKLMMQACEQALKDCSEEEKWSVAKPLLCISTQLLQQKDTQQGCCQARLRKGCGGMTQTQGVQRRATAAGGSG